MTRRLTLAAFALPLLLLIAPAPAAAGAREDMSAAFEKFLALKTFRATIRMVKPTPSASAVEFQAPDRYRIAGEGRPAIVIIGDSAYMNVGGQDMKLPLPISSMTAQYRDPDFLRKLQAGLDIEDLGPATLDGEATRKLRYEQDVVVPAVPGVAPAPAPAPAAGKPDRSTTIAWISVESGHLIKLEVSATYGGTAYLTEIRYSGFDDPAISIQPPK